MSFGSCSLADMAALPERAATVLRHVRTSAAMTASDEQQYRQELVALRGELATFIDGENCHPILLRLAWHDAGTYDGSLGGFPVCGGANGSIRMPEELKHGGNAGLSKAVRFLEPFHAKHPIVSWADLIQLAGATAVELAGGPRIPMRYGRQDSDVVPAEGNLPDATPPDPEAHVRHVFERMGLDDEETVALMGAHTLGRAFKNRSGTVEEGPGDASATKYTHSAAIVRGDGHSGVGMPGGRSWVRQWLKFDNSYFQQQAAREPEALGWLPTDAAMTRDARYRPHFQRFADSQDAFFAAYARAHSHLSSLGSRFLLGKGEGITL